MRIAWVTMLTCALAAVFAAAPAAGDDQDTLRRYAAGTWASMAAMTDPASGLPTDQLFADGRREVQTSTTNIGAYLWSAVAAERLGMIGKRELRERAAQTLTTLEGMERDGQSGGRATSWPVAAPRPGSRAAPWPGMAPQCRGVARRRGVPQRRTAPPVLAPASRRAGQWPPHGLRPKRTPAAARSP